MIVIIEENDWYGLIPNFDFPRRVFLHFILWRKNLQVFFIELLYKTIQKVNCSTYYLLMRVD